MAAVSLDTFDQVVDFLRRAWEKGELDFVATTVSPWHALGVDAALRRLHVKTGSKKGVVVIQAHVKDGILLSPDDFISQTFHDIVFVIQQNVHMGPFASQSAQGEFVRALHHVAQGARNQESSLIMVSPMRPALWLLRIFADIPPPRLSFVVVDEGVGTYAPGSHWEVVAKLDHESSTQFITQNRAVTEHFSVPSGLFGAALRKCSIEYRFLFERANGTLRVLSPVAEDYKAVIGARVKAPLLQPADDRPRAVVLTQPFSEYHLMSQKDECEVISALVASLKRLGFTVVLKPHPRENEDKYRTHCNAADFTAVTFLQKSSPAEMVFHQLGPSDVVVGFTSTALLTAKALYGIPSYTAGGLLRRVPHYHFLDESIRWFRSMSSGLVREFSLLSEVEPEMHYTPTWCSSRESHDDGRMLSRGKSPLTLAASSAGRRVLLSIIIPVHGEPEITKRCLEAVGKYTDCPYEVILVDNGNSADVKAVIETTLRKLDRWIVVQNPENYGYPRACNQGLEIGTGDYFVVMNNDVLVTPRWASRLLAAFSVDPRLGIIGPRTNFASGPQRVDEALYTEESLNEWSERWYQDKMGSLRPTGRLVGFLMVIKRGVVDQIGGFDPLFGTGNFEDDDFSLRAQLAGYKLAIADGVFVHHYGSRSFLRKPREYAQLLETNRRLFFAKWDLPLTVPGYNVQLVLERSPRNRSEVFIPLSFREMFSPNIEPLDLEHPSTRRILCIPDPSDVADKWLQVPYTYLSTMSPDEGTALVIRVEPTDNAWLQHVVSRMVGLASRLGIDLDRRDDVIVEARKLPSVDRGKVYRAASVFAPSPGVRRDALVREAVACGLSVVTDLRPEVLRVALTASPVSTAARFGST